jgi:hypothetical protein
MHYYSQVERATHLKELVGALEALLPELERSGKYPAKQLDYKRACERAKELLLEGFTQEDLSALSRSVPRLFWLHKEWMPPLESIKAGGGFGEPEWFRSLEPLEAKVSEAAEKLRVVGVY